MREHVAMITMASAVVVSALAVPACGGETSNGGGCGSGAACGGDVVGTWQVAAACVSGSGQQTTTLCNEPLSYDLRASSYSGTVTFNADGTYTPRVSVTGSSNVTYPASCLGPSGLGLTCEQLDQSLKSTPPGATGVRGSGCTTLGGGACRCELQIQSPPSMMVGTYSTNGTSITTTIGASTSTGEYCVQGNQLTLSATSTSTMSGTVQTGATGHIVLTKQ